MKPFVDSTAIVGDASELRRRMDRDGYLYVKGLLPKMLLEKLRLKWLAILDQEGWLKEGTKVEQGIANLQAFCVEPEQPYMEVMTRVLSLMELQAIQHHPDLLALLERLLDGTVFPHPRMIGRTIFPQKVEYTTPPHQDWIPIQGTAQTFTAWFSMNGLGEEMGGLQLSTGSHRGGIYDFRPALGAGGMEVTDRLEGDWVNSPVEQGDVLFFHSMMVHKGVANRSNRLRLSIDARFQRVDEPIAPGSLDPHGKEVRNWEQVYAGWPADSELKYYWRKYPLRVQPFDPSYFEKRDRLGLEMAAAGDIRARSVLQRIVARSNDPAKRAQAESLLAKLEQPPGSKGPGPLA